MKYLICFYTNNKFRTQEEILLNHYNSIGFDKVINYRSEDVKTGDFYLKNKEILDSEIGDGYWLWKPKIILDTFDKMEYGDVLVYTDAGDSLSTNILENIKNYMVTNDFYFTNWGGARWPQKICTKRDCFILMGCDTDKYHETSQMEAGFLILRKSDKIIDFIKEYLEVCSNKQIVGDDENIYGENFPNWQFHRHDQSILTNLIVKHNFYFSNTLDNMIFNNRFVV